MKPVFVERGFIALRVIVMSNLEYNHTTVSVTGKKCIIIKAG